MIREENDRRWKLAYISVLDVFTLFLPWGSQSESFVQLYFDRSEVPEGYVIDEVSYCHNAQAYRLLIYHPTFDAVEPGLIPPPTHKKAEAFYLPKCRSLEEARTLSAWHQRTKSETDRLREMLTRFEQECKCGAKPDA